jgi:crotonobetainyl-CoA:carnitine CoA-transferase CaiB-like acyl-CoA transferase
LIDIFRSASTEYWVDFGVRHNTAIAPLNSSKTLPTDRHFVERTRWLSAETHGADMLPFPVNLAEGRPIDPGRAPAAGEHSGQILRDLLGLGDEEIDQLVDAGIVEP